MKEHIKINKTTIGEIPNTLFMESLKKDCPTTDWLTEITSNFHKRVGEDFEKHLKEYITKNLERLGFTFKSEKEFIDFLTARVHQIAFQDRPQYYELYLDFVSEDNKGPFIGCYSNKITTSFNEGFMNLKIGEE